MTTITSFDPAIVSPGQEITFNLTDANASGKSVTIPAGACTIVSQSADHITIVCPELHTFGARTSNYGNVTFTISDGGDTDTQVIEITPPPEGFWGEVDALTGINSSGVSIGNFRYGEFSVGGGTVDFSDGAVVPQDISTLQVWTFTTSWTASPTEYNFTPPLADNVIALALLPEPPLRSSTSPYVITTDAGWEGAR